MSFPGYRSTATPTLRDAIAEKHERLDQVRIVADHKGDAAVELLRQQARVGHAKRSLAATAGAAPPVRESFKQQLLAEIELLERRIAIGQEWGVV
jgi:hypothetical protein